MPKLGIGLEISKFWHRIIGDKAAKKCYGKMMSISSLPQNINMEHIITIQPHTLNYHICHIHRCSQNRPTPAPVHQKKQKRLILHYIWHSIILFFHKMLHLSNLLYTFAKGRLYSKTVESKAFGNRSMKRKISSYL